MKLAALRLSASALHAARPSVDFDRLLSCIAMVEGHAWADPGGALALGAATWRQHTRLPYRYASFPDYAVPVARLHLTWLSRSLERDGIEATAYALAVCWRYGFEGGKVMMRNRAFGYGRRVEALFNSHAGR
jgi:hypothetical protein